MRLFRSLLPAALLALASTSQLHAAQTALLTCGGGTPIKVSYFDIGAPTGTTSIGAVGYSTPTPGTIGSRRRNRSSSPRALLNPLASGAVLATVRRNFPEKSGYR